MSRFGHCMCYLYREEVVRAIITFQKKNYFLIFRNTIFHDNSVVHLTSFRTGELSSFRTGEVMSSGHEKDD